jgi:predicted dinucleotide-binding enzyme
MRGILGIIAAAALSLAFAAIDVAYAADSLKIGIIGSGRVGSTLGELWAKAGHPVMFSSLDLVRAFNSFGVNSLRSEAHRSGAKIAIPLAADDQDALKVAMRLVQDAGFEPVVVGGLGKARSFDVGTPVFGKAMTAAELRKALGLGS